MLIPKSIPKQAKVVRICLASVYISPRSKFKTETIHHLIESIHYIKSVYESISLVVTGDFNRTDISSLLDSYGALQNIDIKPTRKEQKLDLIITDVHTFYLPSVTLPPLDVDHDKKGVASDHDIIIFAPG